MYAALITGPFTAVSKWSSIFIRSKIHPQRQNVFFFFYPTVGALLPPGHDYTLHVLKLKRLTSPPPPPHSSLVLRVSYSLSLLVNPASEDTKPHIIIISQVCLVSQPRSPSATDVKGTSRPRLNFLCPWSRLKNKQQQKT